MREQNNECVEQLYANIADQEKLVRKKSAFGGSPFVSIIRRRKRVQISRRKYVKHSGDSGQHSSLTSADHQKTTPLYQSHNDASINFPLLDVAQQHISMIDNPKELQTDIKAYLAYLGAAFAPETFFPQEETEYYRAIYLDAVGKREVGQ